MKNPSLVLMLALAGCARCREPEHTPASGNFQLIYEANRVGEIDPCG
jgi:hypothetical protein